MPKFCSYSALKRAWAPVLVSLFVAIGGVGAPGAVATASPIAQPTFVSPQVAPILARGDYVFVTNTAADTVDVIARASNAVVARVHVGIDPVSLAMRPDGRELWVANHVSDTVSIIDVVPASATFLQVIATVQDVDPDTRATRFDEPVGIAFASDAKAYVALSTANEIAIVDTTTRRVTGHLTITAQDPRAIMVAGDRLYVLPFESNNRTQLSGCRGNPDGDICTFRVKHPLDSFENTIFISGMVDIIKHPDFPDRDLYVFDTASDELVQIVEGLGTLLYGMTIDSAGRLFITQTDARNEINGRAGTQDHSLGELENRAFLNRITRLDCAAGDLCGAPEFIELEPLPPAQPAPGQALATPYAVQVMADDSTLVVTAAGSDLLFTVNAVTGEILGRVGTGAVPRGLALQAAPGGITHAWVMNGVEDSVQRIDVTDPANLRVLATIALEDPTHPQLKRGRHVFNDASASTTGTFSCASCHPDGNTDQLAWVLQSPFPLFASQEPTRNTMTLRGLRDTWPYHWDGLPGNPYEAPDLVVNCDDAVPESCTRDVVDGSLATTMCLLTDCPENDEGKAGAFSAAQRDDLAMFLLNIPFPPSQHRAYDNLHSEQAKLGFREFHIDGDSRGAVCGDCHRMPFWVSGGNDNSDLLPVEAELLRNAPTWRGANDRWKQSSTALIDALVWQPPEQVEAGFQENQRWRYLLSPNTWNMVTEGSTGYVGAFARNLTLSATSADDALTANLLNAAEAAHGEGSVVLQGEGILLSAQPPRTLALEFDGENYVERALGELRFTRANLIAMAQRGAFVGTFTARAPQAMTVDYPQPGLWVDGAINEEGPQQFPVLAEGDTVLELSARHVLPGAGVYVNGRRVNATVACLAGALPDCEHERITVTFEVTPAPLGLHLLQVQNPASYISNDFIFFTGDEAMAGPLRDGLARRLPSGAIHTGHVH